MTAAWRAARTRAAPPISVDALSIPIYGRERQLRVDEAAARAEVSVVHDDRKQLALIRRKLSTEVDRSAR